MRKQIRKLSIHRETLLQLNPGELVQAAGGDREPLYTVTLPPTKDQSCASLCSC